MKNTKQIIAFLHAIEKLKNVERAVSISNNQRKESPAEHSWRAAVMAMLLHSQYDLQFDLLKTVKMILVHDIVEAYTGDEWIKDQNDQEARAKKHQLEKEAAHKIFSLLPGQLDEELKGLWLEFEESQTEEAKFAQALDKIEVIIQRTDLHAKNWEQDNIFDILYHWADDKVKECSSLCTIWKLVQEELKVQVEN